MKMITKMLAAIVSVGLSSAAMAVPTAWSPASGTAATFDFSGGSNSTDLAGNPFFASATNTFVFNPQNFRASAPGNGTASDISSVTLTPHSGFRISSLLVTLSGDAAILPGATPALAAAVAASPTASYISGLTASRIGGAGTASNSVQGSFDTAGGHSIEAGFSLAIPTDWRKLSLNLNDVLATTTAFGGTAFAEIKTLSLRVSTVAAVDGPVAVPLPLAAFAAIPTIGLAAWAVRRSKKKTA